MSSHIVRDDGSGDLTSDLRGPGAKAGPPSGRRRDGKPSDPASPAPQASDSRPKLKEPISPALLKHEKERADAAQNRVADRITDFSGSMLFVYLHIIWFGCWIGFGVEEYPFGLLTMIVSLEAIFLSTFVMISQNRADAKRQVIADEQWKMVQEEDNQNKELLELSRQILVLTKEVRALAASDSPGSGARSDQPRK
jgi:uncharacterized membrane protein